MQSYEILKTFKYSPDGIKIVDLRKGDINGINDKDIESMIKAGYIKEVTSKNEILSDIDNSIVKVPFKKKKKKSRG